MVNPCPREASCAIAGKHELGEDGVSGEGRESVDGRGGDEDEPNRALSWSYEGRVALFLVVDIMSVELKGLGGFIFCTRVYLPIIVSMAFVGPN